MVAAEFETSDPRIGTELVNIDANPVSFEYCYARTSRLDVQNRSVNAFLVFVFDT